MRFQAEGNDGASGVHLVFGVVDSGDRRSPGGFLRRIWADPAGTPDFSWGYEVMYASEI